ncbi:MAG: DUF4377 domain-containing protein, partial [Desulfobacterales bacterium]|nr:DUF4377 domain-containing protein [Desulfobacterales bacterium]
FFYDEIENFFYKEGYFYEITVRVTEIDNPPIDSSSKKYMLTEIISREEEYETKTLLINSSLADCVGVSPRKCMLIREAESDEWKFFYDEIENFFYKEGYFYEITVRVTEIDNPPIDGSSKKYMLTEIISRTNLYSQSADILYNLLKSHTVIPKEN